MPVSAPGSEAAMLTKQQNYRTISSGGQTCSKTKKLKSGGKDDAAAAGAAPCAKNPGAVPQSIPVDDCKKPLPVRASFPWAYEWMLGEPVPPGLAFTITVGLITNCYRDEVYYKELRTV
jgi:hypothetical protein